jgi:hypothetical protein
LVTGDRKWQVINDVWRRLGGPTEEDDVGSAWLMIGGARTCIMTCRDAVAGEVSMNVALTRR